MRLKNYWQLMRFHKPVGLVLLWAPTAWALWLANKGSPPIHVLIYFILGTICMRAAGCVFNDITDRHIDKHVTRTKTRPLSHGDIAFAQTWYVLITLLIAAFFCLLQLPSLCFYYALFALILSGIYPFCKRFIQTPQIILGIAFSMGIPMAYAASHTPMNLITLIILIINVAWIVAYDTMYAMADREDDSRIQVKSTAIYFANFDWIIILTLQVIFHSLWLVIGYKLHVSVNYYLCWLGGLLILIYQQRLLHHRPLKWPGSRAIKKIQPTQLQKSQFYLQAFSSNAWYGMLMWFGLIISYM